MASLLYYTFNEYLKKKFGEKVYRVSIDAGFDCPNRDGSLAKGGCTYCDEGSRAPGVNPTLSIREQMKTGMERVYQRYNAKKFIAYFQAFTNTYAPTKVLRERYYTALDFPEVVGLSVSTRPDTLEDSALNLLQEISMTHEAWLELGLQTIHDATQKKLNRWHTYAQFLDALHRARQKSNIKICVHIILGLPGETREQMIETMDAVASLPIDGIKIHLLHIIKNTVLHKVFLQGKIQVIEESEYISLVCDFLEKLPSTVVIHRLTGEAEPAKMIAPLWVLEKAHVLQEIQNELVRRKTFQGAHALPIRGNHATLLNNVINHSTL